MFSIMKRRIYKLKRQPQTFTELDIAANKVWLEIEESIRNNLINSIPKRLRLVVEKSGNVLKY